MAGLVFITDAHAQNRVMSLRLGVSVSQLDGEAAFDPLLSFTGALAVRQYLGPVFAQTEASVSIRGAAADVSRPYPPVPGAGGRTYSRLRTDITYLDVPLLLGVHLGGRNLPFIYAGPYLGMSFNAQNRFTYSDTGLTTTRDARDVRFFDYGAMAGAGMEIPTRFYRITIDLRAGAGMAQIFDDSDDERHRMVSLTGGIIF